MESGPIIRGNRWKHGVKCRLNSVVHVSKVSTRVLRQGLCLVMSCSLSENICLMYSHFMYCCNCLIWSVAVGSFWDRNDRMQTKMDPNWSENWDFWRLLGVDSECLKSRRCIIVYKPSSVVPPRKYPECSDTTENGRRFHVDSKVCCIGARPLYLLSEPMRVKYSYHMIHVVESRLIAASTFRWLCELSC